jgi:UDP-glucose 4-epimerase
LGEEHEPETHLIPLLLRAVMSGQPVTVFGDDYDTPDGTCIRDYIHVNDLAQAHILALDYLLGGGASDQFNVGTSTGHSVMETIRAVEAVTGKQSAVRGGPAAGRRSAAPGGGVRQTTDQAGLAAAIHGTADDCGARVEVREDGAD